jgi:hypothetical protein
MIIIGKRLLKPLPNRTIYEKPANAQMVILKVRVPGTDSQYHNAGKIQTPERIKKYANKIQI